MGIAKIKQKMIRLWCRHTLIHTQQRGVHGLAYLARLALQVRVSALVQTVAAHLAVRAHEVVAVVSESAVGRAVRTLRVLEHRVAPLRALERARACRVHVFAAARVLVVAVGAGRGTAQHAERVAVRGHRVSVRAARVAVGV